MKRPQRKPLPLLMVLVFSWLVTYQLCDATEDTVEDLNDRAVVVAQPHPSLSAPQLPETEPDALVPQVQDQALVTGNIVLEHRTQTISLPQVETPAAASAPTRTVLDHHPPGWQTACASHVGHSNNLFVSSIQSNAPPAA
jgi:hypothetical protein